VRVLFVTDLHGSSTVLRKAIGAAKGLDIDVLLIGGDLSGKRLVPIVPKGGGSGYVSWEPYKQKDDTGHAVEVPRATRLTEGSLAPYLERLESKGLYWHIGGESEVEALNNDQTQLNRLFNERIYERLASWAGMVSAELPQGVQCYWTGGNDDDPDLLARLRNSDLDRFHYAEDRVIQLGDYELLSLGYSNVTPFNTYRELDEPELLRRLVALADHATNMDRLILNVHVPPSECGALDLCLDGGIPPRSVHVGSTAIRSFIERYQPLADFAGHVHEGRGTASIGRTRVFNPGSDYYAGMMHAYVVSFVKNGVRDYVHLTR
jgi:Icc-related predicted phosphoesterase